MKRVDYTVVGGWVAIAGAVVHLTLTLMNGAEVWAGIVSAGWWNTVTLRPNADQLQRAGAFWVSIGSFAVPLLLLGILAVLSGRNGQRIPGALGWVLVGWGILGASLLPVSGAWAFIVVGLLFAAGDRDRLRQREHDSGETDGPSFAVDGHLTSVVLRRASGDRATSNTATPNKEGAHQS